MKIVKASNGKTRITLSKKEWEKIGVTAGWELEPTDDKNASQKIESIIEEIKEGRSKHFSMGFFDKSNFSDYGDMKDRIKDVSSAYNISEVDGAMIVGSLVHGEEIIDEDDVGVPRVRKTDQDYDLPPSRPGWD